MYYYDQQQPPLFLPSDTPSSPNVMPSGSEGACSIVSSFSKIWREGKERGGKRGEREREREREKRERKREREGEREGW